MRVMRTLFMILTLFATSSAPVFAQSRTEFIASGSEPGMAILNPLRNGLSAITLFWPVSERHQNRAIALRAGMSSILTGGTADMTPFESETFSRIHGLEFDIALEGSALILNMAAPTDQFIAAIEHLNKLLTNPIFPAEWYQRELLRSQPVRVTKNRRPSNIINTMVTFLQSPIQSDNIDASQLSFRFGMPNQIIIRTPLEEPGKLAQDAVKSLEFNKSSTTILGVADQNQSIPKGVIYIPDKNSTEMMILFVNHQKFATEPDLVSANILMNYIGAYQGSEMFRIIRQEMRAAYDPKSDFSVTGKKQALLSLSATVSAEEWQDIHATIGQIYNDTRAGIVSESGLSTIQKRLLRGFEHQFVTNSLWSAKQFLREYPNGSKGEIRLPLFSALVNPDLKTTKQNAAAFLPPLEDYLLVLIGAGPEPTKDMRQNGFCRSAVNQSLRKCLTELLEKQR